MTQNHYKIPPQLQQCISADQAYHYRIVPVSRNGSGLVLKTDCETLDALLPELNIVLDTPVALEHCEREELQQYLTTNYRLGKRADVSQIGYSNDFLEKIFI